MVMGEFLPRTFDLIIASGQTLSNEHRTGEDGYRGPMTITIIAPDILPESVKFQICGAKLRYVDQQSNGTDITFGAGKSITIVIANACGIRLKASVPAGGDRLFEILWNVTTERG